MIPVRLRLHNFMCYRGEATLDFGGIHLACLAGDNGHGKSALLDALTYALWGEARAKREDDLVTLGSDEMEVELEFRLGSERYRVIRKRSRRGRTRQGALELQTWDGEQFQSLSGASARETQARINAILRMSYETFINSAFLLQGRADEFARKPAGERKQILGDILGLSLYDDLEERTRALVRQLELDSQQIEASLLLMQQELKQRPQHEAELARLEREFAQAETQLRQAESALQAARDEKRELDLKARQADELAQRITAARREAEQQEQDAAQKRATIETYVARLGDGVRIADGFAQWQAARQRDDELNKLLARAVKLNAEQSQLEQAVREARQLLEFELRSAETRLAALDEQSAEAERLLPELERTQQQLRVHEEREAQRDALREQREALNTRAAELRVTNQQLRVHMNALEEKIEQLKEADATCPLCRQPISAAEARRLCQTYLDEGKQSAETYRANAAQLDQHAYQLDQWRTTLQKLEQELRAKPALQSHEARLSDMLQRAEVAQAERETLQAQVESVRTQLETRAYAPAQQARLQKLAAQWQALGYDPQQHEALRAQLTELAAYEQENAQLQSARERLAAERELLGHLEANLARTRQLIASDEALWQKLRDETARLDDLNRAVAEQQKRVNELQGRAAALNRQLGAARQWVEHARQTELALAEKQQTLKANHAERALHEELRVAFGKKGVQAMLIEAAIPEIEQEANALLAQMTDGRMNVRLETQREKLTAKKDDAATIETLDIVISDELGPRNYEMYSGGEAFRVNFAVRIALSKLLARRAGARLQTLVIDEGFGALDATGRERLVEAITAVQDQFEKILVITHIDELKDMFPVRIDVVKTGSGSSIFFN